MFFIDLFIIISLGFLSLVGLLGCTVFAANQFGFTLPKPLQLTVPTHNDASIATTRWGKLLGIPNWWLGTFFYVLTFTVAMFSFVPAIPPSLILLAISGSIIAVITSLVLLYGERAVLKVNCSACRIIHLANFAILGVWITTAVILSSTTLP
jgi:uncharacterized membrane protein